jgi:hypothetical protein
LTEPVGFVETVAFDDIPAPAFPGVTRLGDNDVRAGAGRVKSTGVVYVVVV